MGIVKIDVVNGSATIIPLPGGTNRLAMVTMCVPHGKVDDVALSNSPRIQIVIHLDPKV